MGEWGSASSHEVLKGSLNNGKHKQQEAIGARPVTLATHHPRWGVCSLPASFVLMIIIIKD